MLKIRIYITRSFQAWSSRHSGPEYLKKSRPKNSSNMALVKELNQFHGILGGYFLFYEGKIVMENIPKIFL